MPCLTLPCRSLVVENSRQDAWRTLSGWLQKAAKGSEQADGSRVKGKAGGGPLHVRACAPALAGLHTTPFFRAFSLDSGAPTPTGTVEKDKDWAGTTSSHDDALAKLCARDRRKGRHEHRHKDATRAFCSPGPVCRERRPAAVDKMCTFRLRLSQ